MSIIYATRRGFLYQDRFAVAKYLEQWQNKNIKNFYVDFPLPGKKSLDVKHIDQTENENVYEIKSGEEFKKDKRKKDSSEVRDAFIDLQSYKNNNSSCILNLIIRKGFVNNIATYWECIKFIQIHPFNYPETQNKLKILFTKLKLPGISSIEDLFNFCQSVHLDDAPNDEINNEIDKFSDIDDYVIEKIDDIMRIFNAQTCRVEYPDEILMKNLYHLCRIYAGSGKDVHEIFTKEISDFISQRKFLDECYDPNNGRGNSKERIAREVGLDVKQFLNIKEVGNINLLKKEDEIEVTENI